MKDSWKLRTVPVKGISLRKGHGAWTKEGHACISEGQQFQQERNWEST